MLIIGVVIIIVIVFLIWREYTSYLGRELNVCRAFRAMLCDMRDKMRCYLDTPRTWALGYEDDLLSECGFLGRLRLGASLADAYDACKETLCISKSVDSTLRSLFARSGEGYIDTELVAIDSAITNLTATEGVMSGEVNKKSKVAGAVLGAFVAGIVILVM